jgi:DNA-binding CsgD family transcriptional regulator
MSGAENPLSKREQEILTLVARGLSNQEIARELVISQNTVKVHLRNIFAKLEATSRTDALVKAAQAGWIDVDGLEEPAEGEERPAEPIPLAPPLASWQRVYFFVAAVLVAAALLVPGVVARVATRPPTTDLSDAGLPRLGAPARADVTRWTSLAPLPQPRSRLGLASVDALLFAIGGEGPEGVVGAVDVYDPETNGWLPRSAKPLPVANVQAAAIDGLVYVPGGTEAGGAVSSALDVYDPAEDAWTTAASLPAPIAAYGLASHDGNLYLFGGWNGATYVDTVRVYDPASDTWETRSPMPERVGFAAAAPLGERILVVGGFDGAAESNACSLYNPVEDRWETCAPMILPRGGLGLAVDGTSAYAIGGGWQRVLSFNERYDSLTNTWSSIPSPVQGEWRLPGVAGQGALIYAVGGWSGDYLDSNEVFQSTFRAFLPLGTRGN